MPNAEGTSWPSVSAAPAIAANRKKKRRKRPRIEIETVRARQGTKVGGTKPDIKTIRERARHPHPQKKAPLSIASVLRPAHGEQAVS